MGFDASLGFVINLGAPQSPVAYYQQVGRAGRGTDDATVVLLPQIEDRDIWAYFASLGFPREEQVRETLAALAASERPMSTATLETRVELGRNRLESMLKVLDVDGAVQRVQGGWVATGQPWTYDAERYARVAEAREREQQAMLGYLRTTECRMRYLREQLDDPEAADCGRCDNCGGVTLSSSVSDAAVAEAGQRLSRPGVVLEPRRMWPTALANLGLDLKGKIAAGAEPGRTVARLTDLGHGQALRALFREDTPDGPVPPGLAQAVMDVMKDWSSEWASRPDAIVVVESATRPTLVGDLAAGLSRVMQVPVVGTWAIRDPAVPPRAGASNSAQRVAAVRRRGGLDAEVPPGSTVLLVDDQVATGWTLTVAATAIRAAGADAVLPLALATQG
jgi:ATP-dependent DNA helicase RecQ